MDSISPPFFQFQIEKRRSYQFSSYFCMLLIFLIDQHFSVKKGQLKRFDINNNNKQFIKLLLGELERTLFNVSLAGCLLVNGNKKTKNSDKGENNRVHGIHTGNKPAPTGSHRQPFSAAVPDVNQQQFAVVHQCNMLGGLRSNI